MDKVVLQLIDELKNLNSLNECYEVIDKYCDTVDGFEDLDLNLFRYKDIYIRSGKIFNLEPQKQIFEKLSEFNLYTAPEFVAYIRLENNEDMILITRIQNSQNSSIEPYINERKNVTTDAKQELIHDFDELAKKNIYNPIINSAKEWFVISTTKKLYIDNWIQLKTFTDNNEKAEKRSSLLSLLEM